MLERIAGSRSLMNVISVCRDKPLMMCLVLLSVVVGCSRSHPPLHPSYEELTRRGFYVYVLPEEEVNDRKWTQTVTIWSWDKHCSGGEIGEVFNPIRVSYGESQGQSGLTILIGPWSMYWDNREPTTEVELNTLWGTDDTAAYYIVDGYVHLRFEDRFGFPVQVLSNIPITEVVQLVNQLEYIGPPPESVSNPWDCSR